MVLCLQYNPSHHLSNNIIQSLYETDMKLQQSDLWIVDVVPLPHHLDRGAVLKDCSKLNLFLWIWIYDEAADVWVRV